MPLIRPEDRKLFKQIGQFSAVGLELAISVTIGAVAGLLLDDWLGTEPYLMLVGLVFGSIAGFRSLYRTARKAMPRDEDEKKDG